MARPFDPNEILHLPLMATLATASEDGAPRNAPMWFIWEDDALWLPASVGTSSVRRLRRDSRCAVEIVKFDNPVGVLLHLGLRGFATVEPMDPERFRGLLRKYLGAEENWNPWFIETIAAIDDPDGRLIRFAPESVFTNNVSHFRTGPKLAWPPDEQEDAS